MGGDGAMEPHSGSGRACEENHYITALHLLLNQKQIRKKAGPAAESLQQSLLVLHCGTNPTFIKTQIQIRNGIFY